jgi:hypothetical protein
MLTTGMLEKMAKAIARAAYESKFGRQILAYYARDKLAGMLDIMLCLEATFSYRVDSAIYVNIKHHNNTYAYVFEFDEVC